MPQRSMLALKGGGMDHSKSKHGGRCEPTSTKSDPNSELFCQCRRALSSVRTVKLPNCEEERISAAEEQAFFCLEFACEQDKRES